MNMDFATRYVVLYNKYLKMRGWLGNQEVDRSWKDFEENIIESLMHLMAFKGAVSEGVKEG